MRHDRLDSSCLVEDADWPAIVSFFGGDGGASVIAPAWLLTAGHTAANVSLGHQLLVNGEARRVVEIRFHPGADRRSPLDIALVRLDQPVASVTPLGLYERRDECGKTALLFGRGDFGNGRDGVLGVDHRLRCVTNRIESCDDRWLRLRFDAPPRCTRLEGVCGEGDSGGPALVRDRSALWIVGVSSWQDHSGALATYGCVEHYARVSTIVDWIRSVVVGHAREPKEIR
jgi:hypothetical protein